MAHKTSKNIHDKRSIKCQKISYLKKDHNISNFWLKIVVSHPQKKILRKHGQETLTNPRTLQGQRCESFQLLLRPGDTALRSETENSG